MSEPDYDKERVATLPKISDDDFHCDTFDSLISGAGYVLLFLCVFGLPLLPALAFARFDGTASGVCVYVMAFMVTSGLAGSFLGNGEGAP